MRAAVIASGSMLVLSVVLLAPVLLLSDPVPGLFVWFVYPGFAALLISPAILLAAALASLVPSVNEHLKNCQH